MHVFFTGERRPGGGQGSAQVEPQQGPCAQPGAACGAGDQQRSHLRPQDPAGQSGDRPGEGTSTALTTHFQNHTHYILSTLSSCWSLVS